jgi:HK97 gp10 family phage protein
VIEITLKTEGLDEAIQYWRSFKAKEKRELQKVLKSTSQILLKEMRKRVPVATGRLRKALKMSKKGAFGYTVGVDGRNSYYFAVTGGRKAGSRMPPLNNPRFRQWLALKGFSEREAFVVARSIARRGIRARPFMTESAEAVREKIFADLQRAVRKVIKKSGK